MNHRRLIAGFLVALTVFSAGASAVYAEALDSIVNDAQGIVAKAAISCFTNKLQNKIFGNTSTGNTVPSSDQGVESATSSLDNKATCLNVVERAAAQVILKELTVSVVNWINHGFNGNPLYSKDTGSLLKNIGDQAVRDFNSTIAFNSKNYPFGRAAAQALTSQLQTSFAQRARYSLDQVIAMQTPGATPKDFANDFAVGGWDAFMSQIQPNNNPIGFNFIASDEISYRLQDTYYSPAQSLKDSLMQSGGFLSIRTCVDPGYSSKNADEIVANDKEQLDALLAEDDKNGVTTMEQDAKEEALRNLISNQGCSKWTTTTPGSVISHQLNTTLDIPSNQLVSGQDLSTAITAIFDALANQLVTKGLSSLSAADQSGSITDTQTGSGYDLTVPGDTLGNTNWTAGPNFNMFTDIPTLITNEYNDADSVTGVVFKASPGHDEFNDPTKPRGYQQVVKEENDVIPQLITSIYELDYCVPGPRPTWQGDTQRGLNAQLLKWPRSVDMVGGDLGAVGRVLSGTIHDLIATSTADTRSEKMYAKIISAALTMDGPGVGVTPNSKVNGYANASNAMTTLYNRYATALNGVYGGGTDQDSLDYRSLEERAVDSTEYSNITKYQKAMSDNQTLMDQSVATESQLRALVVRINNLPKQAGYPGDNGTVRDYKADWQASKDMRFSQLNDYQLELRHIVDTFQLIAPHIHGTDDVRKEEATLSALKASLDSIGGKNGTVDQCIKDMQSPSYHGPNERIAFPADLLPYLQNGPHKLLDVFPPDKSFLPDWHYAEGGDIVIGANGTGYYPGGGFFPVSTATDHLVTVNGTTIDTDKLIKNDDVVTISNQNMTIALSGFEEFLGMW